MSDINTIVGQVRQATDFQINKKILREKIQTDLHFAYNGGLFKCTQELISFVRLWPIGDALYLEDTYQNPIHIPDPEFFVKLAQQHYQQVMNHWHNEYEELRKIRKI